jgi:hypothetical protein
MTYRKRFAAVQDPVDGFHDLLFVFSEFFEESTPESFVPAVHLLFCNFIESFSIF